MNILILNDFGFVSGGAASVAISSAKGLASRNHRVIFFTAIGPVDPSLSQCGVEVINTDQDEIRRKSEKLSSQLQMTWNVRAARTLNKLLSELDPKNTVVHLHNWTKALSSSIARVLAKRGYKKVCTLHDYAVACPRGSFFDLGTLEHCKIKPLSWDCISNNCGRQSLKHQIFRTTRQAVQNTFGKMPISVDAFVFVTRFSRRILEPFLPKSSLLCEIPNPIDLARGEPVQVESNDNFFMVGRLTREKGTLLLARAAKECNLPIVFVGDGPTRSEVSAVNPDALITGWLPSAQVTDYLRKARTLVFPSMWYETQGLVVAEAAAVGVPAIVSDTSAATEIVHDGLTGLTFKNGDLQSLKSAMVRMSSDSNVRRMGAASYETYWKDPPTLEKHLDRLEYLYRTLLQ